MVLLGAVGLSALIGTLDFVLLPVLAIFLGLVVYGLLQRRRSGDATSSEPMNDCCSTQSKTYDLAIMGAGSAGFSAAMTAAEQGASVALIGCGTIGGACVNVGCVPSKTMIRAMEGLHAARSAGRFPGLDGEASVQDWGRLVAAKDDLVGMLREKKYVGLLKGEARIDYREGRARLVDGAVLVDGALVPARKIVIATGSSPAAPEIPGLEGVSYLTSTTALELSALPKSLLVIGGGYIGCELAQMFGRAGVRVMIATRRRLLPEAEPEISAALTTYFGDEGVDVRAGLAYRRIERTSDGVALTADTDAGPTVLRAEQILIATGRTPNTAGLGLGEAGVRLAPGGGVLVDAHLRTSKPGVYAAGDVTGKDQFVYMAAYGAKLAALNALNGDSLIYDNTAMPWVVFTDPHVAGVGHTEASARRAGFAVKTSILSLEQLPRALAARDVRGLIKLVADAETDRLIGGQVLAPEGADSIQTLALALTHAMTASGLAAAIFPYLTTVEGLKLAAQGFSKDVDKLSCCAG